MKNVRGSSLHRKKMILAIYLYLHKSMKYVIAKPRRTKTAQHYKVTYTEILAKFRIKVDQTFRELIFVISGIQSRKTLLYHKQQEKI